MEGSGVEDLPPERSFSRDDCRDISEDVQRHSRAALRFSSFATNSNADLEEGSQTVAEEKNIGERLMGKASSHVFAWLTAGRVLEDEEGGLLESDKEAFHLRVLLIALYGSFHVFAAWAAAVHWAVLSKHGLVQALVCFVHGIIAVFCFCGLHFANRYRLVRQRTAFSVFTGVMIFLNLCGCPLFLQIVLCSQGWHWAGGAIIWVGGAPLASIALTDRPQTVAFAVVCCMLTIQISIM
eukprot:3338073-Rhodomonas_salina.1